MVMQRSILSFSFINKGEACEECEIFDYLTVEKFLIKIKNFSMSTFRSAEGHDQRS